MSTVKGEQEVNTEDIFPPKSPFSLLNTWRKWQQIVYLNNLISNSRKNALNKKMWNIKNHVF